MSDKRKVINVENSENTLYFVTGNNNKFNEVFQEFQEANLNYDLKQLNIKTIEIQADSIKEVALFKLNSVKEKIKNSFFIEDAGFFVDVPLKGFPGVYSSYIHKIIGNEGILTLIGNFKSQKRILPLLLPYILNR